MKIKNAMKKLPWLITLKVCMLLMNDQISTLSLSLVGARVFFLWYFVESGDAD